MAVIGGGSSGSSRSRDGRRSVETPPNVEELLNDLHLTAEEEAVADFSDNEGDNGGVVEAALIGKVLSPVVLHANTILGALKPAWGNPYGLKIRTVGWKGDNLFVAEFGSRRDMERTQTGSPWLIGKHAVILQDYDARLKPSDICFTKMDLWVRIPNLPLGWMNHKRGERAMSLVGNVVRMDIDKDGKTSGAYLRARVSIEIA
ncbi:hypothetical protein QOZ80_3AG0214650 [Eleusine coracana subsp. coracana]|nr:hypothetical protein QOZ80_3AG0214650 [Eleusine coracana subsp. coracana]